ncbi:ash family protein [Salmonella enterica subsp. enterica serovar Muenchen]|nr:ash family protein [Salmonella enterica subsp. enterica serovar Muenchen]
MGALSTPIAGGKPMKRPPITTSRRPHKMIDRTTPPGYRYHALYKTSAGIGTPNCKKATPDAASVFFVVRYTRHSMAWCVLLNPVSIRIARMSTTHHAAHNGTICGCCVRLRPAIDAQNCISRRPIMVTLAGQPQGWPVSFLPGSSNPVNVTAPIEIGTSGGDSLTSKKEAA